MSSEKNKPGSGDPTNYNDANGNQDLIPELDKQMNESGRKPDRDKQGRNGGMSLDYDYDEEESNQLGKFLENFHPKDREDMLRDFLAKSRFQSYLNQLVDIFIKSDYNI